MATALSSLGSIATAPFKVGSKERYLPSFTVALLRNDHLGANHARFQVPLWFSKLDLRDYLYHAYNVRIFRITSYVKQQRVSREDPGARSDNPVGRRRHRPQAKKYMTVQLERPFVWPETPEDLSAWENENVKMREKDMQDLAKLMGGTGDAIVNEPRRKSMKEQAKALLDGREKWKPSTSNKSLGQMLSSR